MKKELPQSRMTDIFANKIPISYNDRTRAEYFRIFETEVNPFHENSFS